MEVLGIYDPGSNVSLVNSKLLKLKKSEKKYDKNAKLVTINGVKRTKGLTNLKIKIMEIEKHMDVYIVDGKEFKYDFLIGLDIIKEFKLAQDEHLEISQKNRKTVNGKGKT